MKKYTKIWLSSFLISTSAFVLFAIAFINLFDLKYPQSSLNDTQPEPAENSVPNLDEYTDYSDNVGGVSFTEDQMTELVRNIYSLDGIVNNLKVDFNDDKSLSVNGKIKDVDKLCESYPELSDFERILRFLENKNITIRGSLENVDGMAAYKITDACVGDFKIDVNIIAPFMEQGVFTNLFDIDYDSVEITENSVIFKNGLPSALQY